MSDTPETDDLARGNHVVPTEWAEQLERERDEAREELEEYRSIAENIGAKKAVSEKEKAIKERDEANYFLKELSEADGQLKVRMDELCKVLQKAERERDEAREELNNIRINLGEDADGFTLLHAVCALQNERDEARESLKHITEYGTEEINAALELRQKLAQALIERDEMMEELQKLEGAYADATNYYARIIELTYERDETRKEVKYWQELYRTVSVY